MDTRCEMVPQSHPNENCKVGAYDKVFQASSPVDVFGLVDNACWSPPLTFILCGTFLQYQLWALRQSYLKAQFSWGLGAVLHGGCVGHWGQHTRLCSYSFRNPTGQLVNRVQQDSPQAERIQLHCTWMHVFLRAAMISQLIVVDPKKIGCTSFCNSKCVNQFSRMNIWNIRWFAVFFVNYDCKWIFFSFWIVG